MLPGRTALSPQRKSAFQRALLRWYAKGHRDLPWRRTRDPYAILVSEVMLQQTQADRVAPKYLAWMARFPNFQALAVAATREVIREWSGLGYNRRAVNLQAIAREVVTRHGGRLPGDSGSLRAFKGIGAYTAAAVVCFAFDGTAPVVDTNVRRVLGRIVLGGRAASPRKIDAIAEAVLPRSRAYEWNQAMMELGATVCLSRAPRCGDCPARRICRAAPTIQRVLARQVRGKQAQPFKGSRRYYRGRVVEYLRALSSGRGATMEDLAKALGTGNPDPNWVVDLVSGLERDGLVTVRKRRVALPE
ncbi:MAG: A/G-specific adenine glycosylase [Chloroflexi bacterium]|nr:A/G-specific adenine glycosylase [Chloroflexota bacterium]